MVLDDATLGKLVLVVFGLLYFYYTFWIYILPFVDEENFITLFFPSVRYALIVPAILGSLFIGTLMTYIIMTYFLS